METINHYKNHLSNYYSWIFGGFEENSTKNKQFFTDHHIIPLNSKIAIDLGAGSGFQSIPLRQIGFDVFAVDFCGQLLTELQQKDRTVELIEDDILNFKAYANKTPELFICMGDTLTHLPHMNSVELLIKNCYKELVSNGKIVLTLRDLTFELKGEDRFIPVRSDDTKIFTCFLEYHSDYLTVYDIVNEKENNQWEQKISSYKKIKISEEKIKSILRENGFGIDFFNKDKGLITIIGSKG
ncbi:MAG: methyltransferase domain-containing protein [bacterium]|nr:methyltransferase domain-containing protein [bacterium]